jgi:hypothetical protein
MLELSDITALVSSLIEKVKKHYPAASYTKAEMPEYYPSYRLRCKYSERVKIHAELGEFPDQLFLNRAPNQTDKEFNYIKDNYKQNTLPVYITYHSTIMRPWQDGNWSITYSEDESQYDGENGLQAYLETGIKKFGSTENFFKSVYSHLKEVDPNGVIAIRPEVVPTLEDGEIDTANLLEPQYYYYRCDQVIHRKMDEEYLILLDERSMVDYGGPKQNVGYIFEFYDGDNIWRITQVGKYTDFQFEYTLFFNHREGSPPIVEMAGIPQILKNEVVWQPTFLYACDNLDLALMNAQYLQVSIANSCFPYRVMVGSQCIHTEKHEPTGQTLACAGGYIDYPDQTRRKCGSCQGSGLKDRVSPMGVLLLGPEDWSGKGDTPFSDRAMYYVSPDVEALRFVKEKVDTDIDTAKKILHLQTSNSEVKGTENLTATGMGIDMKAMFAFVKPISDRNFQGFEKAIHHTGWQRYGEAFKAPTITYPNTFDYNTEQDYLLQISEAQKAGLPAFLIRTIIYKYLNTLYYNEKSTAEVFTLLIHADRVITLSSEDILLKTQRGEIEKWEAILHDSAISFIDELILENPKFFEQEFTVQKEQLIDKAKAKASVMTQTRTAIPSVDDIVNDVTT